MFSTSLNKPEKQMNHFDDRASYFAFLRETKGPMACLDNNLQQDVSLCTYGGEGKTLPKLTVASDFRQDI